jgi:RNA polymerase sigma-70 factor, ECF subfamily
VSSLNDSGDDDPAKDGRRVEEQQYLAARFEDHRAYLRSLAYRVLGGWEDADDAVQEAWLRLRRAAITDIDNLEAWLTTVTTRVCVDMLRTRAARREQPLEVLLPSMGADPGAADPAGEALLAERVGLALYVVLDALSPAERLAFVLHDLFAVSLDSIAIALGRTRTATKQLAHRARGRVRVADPGDVAEPDLRAQREVVAAFFAAARSGDFEALIALLDPQVELRADGLQAVDIVRGADSVARRAMMFARPDAHVHPARVGDAAGVVVTIEGRPVSMMSFVVNGDRVQYIHAVTDPTRLARSIPSWVR